MTDDGGRGREWVEDNAPMTWQSFKDAFPQNFVISNGGFFQNGNFHVRAFVREGLVEYPTGRERRKQQGGAGPTIHFGFEDFYLNPAAKKFSNPTFTYSRTKNGRVQKHRRSDGHFASYSIEERRVIERQRKKK